MPMNSPGETAETGLEAQTTALLDRHLGAFAKGIDAIMEDYTEASRLLTPDSCRAGLAEIRGFFEGFLANTTPEFWDAFQLRSRAVVGDVAYISWSAGSFVHLATDTIVVRGGAVHVQTFTSLS